jgi:hypothetical protein
MLALENAKLEKISHLEGQQGQTHLNFSTTKLLAPLVTTKFDK